VTSRPLLHAIEELRAWVHTPRRELAVVLPVFGRDVGDPRLVAVGDEVSVRVTPAAVLGCGLRSGATAYALVHTHLTEAPPSAADGAVTRRLVSAGCVLGVELLSHVVLTPEGTYNCLAA
jgi:DNA repair protein RadC